MVVEEGEIHNKLDMFSWLPNVRIKSRSAIFNYRTAIGAQHQFLCIFLNEVVLRNTVTNAKDGTKSDTVREDML